ncbi:MAG TPA: helix-turn-helix domain-containing protein [Caldilineaceae bacterium]|nr:helix-turn-helix domain-containing protein [Caldilineaceae bacterium]
MKILIEGTEVLSVRDAATLANKSTVTIYDWIHKGYIETKTHNEQMFIVKTSLEKYLEERSTE